MIKRASVADVARLAGVSTATVSRVTTHPERVAEPTRTRVLEAIAELNFVKSAAGLSLRRQQANSILVVVNNLGNVYWSEIFQGIHERAEANNYDLMITTLRDERGEERYMERLRTGRVDGVILLEQTRKLNENYDALCKEFGGIPPIVGFCELPGSLRFPHVLIDNRNAAYRATKYLIEAGHRHIAHIRGPEHLPVARERMAGFMEAMLEHQLPVGPDDVWTSEFHRDGGRRTARRMARLASLPTAIFCCTDDVAMGAISELSTLGIRVPEDISIMGFDNNAYADVFVPALTTMAQPREQIGVAATDLLLKVLSDRRGGRRQVSRKPEIIELKVHLARRNSVRELTGAKPLPRTTSAVED
ncbi:MAG: LacI family DNA-binding transcriptional regulator [Hyphomicrobiaceae bacterium]|nr:LacI family DNA-binding transcriptional regulator [Hyphomicrobiaceae bacterium]